MVASVSAGPHATSPRSAASQRSLLIAGGIVVCGALVGGGVLLGTRLEAPAPRAAAATTPIVLTAPSGNVTGHAGRAASGDIAEPSRPSAPLLFTANVNDLPRAPVAAPPRRGGWAPAVPRAAAPAAQAPAAPAANQATPAEQDTPVAAAPEPTAPAASAAPVDSAPPAPAAPVDPLLREIQKAVDDQNHAK
jgi:hypothetical protein